MRDDGRYGSHFGDQTLIGAGERELVAELRRLSYRLDPESVVARRRRAESQRFVSLRPAPDTMTYLTALLPVADGVAAYAALTGAANAARSDGDPRSRGQVMADLLVTRVLGQADGQAPRVPVTVNVVVSDQVLLGHPQHGAKHSAKHSAKHGASTARRRARRRSRGTGRYRPRSPAT